ncbi:MAG: EVE domain-containing protein [Solirubrobacterales bacterium]
MAESTGNWLGVASRDHVLRGVGLGIAQINHGNRAALQRMSAGDRLVYYSARETYPKGAPLKAFTAIGRVADDEVWQADEGDFKPWRRRIDYEPNAIEVPIADLAGDLDLTATHNWGYQLRRGLVELSPRDFQLIRAAMTARR